MKGCYHVAIYYLRVLAVFLAWPLTLLSGMAFITPQVTIGRLTVELNAWLLVGASIVCYSFAASKAVRRF